MQRTPRTRTRKAVALTDPKPEFVSIVRAGANMTPFRAMKSDEPQTDIHMKLTRKSDTHDIARLVFRGDNFKDETAVQAWLDAGGYEGVTVVRAEDGDDVSFSVTAEGAPTEGLQDIDLASGVTASVFVKPVAAAKAAETAAQTPSVDSQGSVITNEGDPLQPVAKSEGALTTEPLEALRVKFDTWDVEYSDEITLGDALADGFDGVPPGFGEVMTAVYAATRNAVIVGKLDSIPAIFSDAAALVQKLAGIFPADVPLSLEVLVALDDERLASYVQKAEGAEPVLDELRLRGDVYFPELTIGDAPLVAGAAKLPTLGENVRQKRDMSWKRKNIVEKAASKPKATGTDQSNDNTAVQQGGSTDTTSAAAKAAEQAQKQDQGTAVPAAPALTVDVLTAAMTAAFAPVIKSVQEVGAAVAAQTVKTDEAIAALTKKSDEAVAVAEKAVAERQTRRAADGDEHVQGKQQTPVQTAKAEATRVVREMGLRGALGMPNRRS
jgi:hypothetical protein